MAKRADSPYASGGRTADWLKVKTAQRQEVVIAGFTAPRRTRPFFGALVLAVREDDAWRYIGHVGTGFSHQALEELHGKLVKLKTAKSPFSAKVKDEQVTTWVRPFAGRGSEVRGVDQQGRAAPAGLSRPAVRQEGQGRRSRKGHGRENRQPRRASEPAIQPAARSDAEGHGGRGGNPRALRTGPNDRR